MQNLKAEIETLNQQIEIKNKEIADLSVENKDLKENVASSSTFTQQQRTRLVVEFDSVTETLRSQLERIQNNVFQQNNMAPPDAGKFDKTDNSLESSDKSHAIQSEDQLFEIMIDKIKRMHKLVSLSSDVLLVSSKQKYLPNAMRQSQNQGINMSNMADLNSSGGNVLVQDHSAQQEDN